MKANAKKLKNYRKRTKNNRIFCYRCGDLITNQKFAKNRLCPFCNEELSNLIYGSIS